MAATSRIQVERGVTKPATYHPGTVADGVDSAAGDRVSRSRAQPAAASMGNASCRRARMPARSS